MSTSDLKGHRKSWRGQPKSAGGRWTGRIVLTVFAVTLLVLFLCVMFWPRPERDLQAFLIHAKSDAGAYQTHLIMPPMYGVSATESIKQRIVRPLSANGLEEFTGTVADIQDQIAKRVRPALEDDDDTVLIVFRGYLMNADQGPAIACSDFGPHPTDPDAATGLLPLDDLFQLLSESVPESFDGTRLVVLDIEPFTSLPRFHQYDDEIFRALEQSVKQHAKHLWVLVTRGPLQSAGWDVQTKMPIATQTFLDAIGGDANRTEANDRVLDLREWVTYTADRYEQLDTADGAKVPAPMLLRGGQGLVQQADQIDFAWITRAPDREPDEPEENVDDEGEPDGDDAAAIVPDDRTLSVKPVVFAAPQRESNPSQPDRGDDGSDSPNADPANADPASADDPDADGPDPSADANQFGGGSVDGASDRQGGIPTPESFWNIRDRLESLRTNAFPHPIAVSPDVWRRLIQVVLHAEIESLDPKSADSGQQVLQPALAGIQQLESNYQADASATPLPFAASDVVSELGQIYEAWQIAARDEIRNRPDVNVTLADRLQHAIVVANVRRWSWRKFQQEASSIGEQVTSPFDSDDPIVEAEAVLIEQTRQSADDQRVQQSRQLRRALNTLRLFIQESDRQVDQRINRLVAKINQRHQARDEKRRSESDRKHASAWREVRQAHALLRSPLPTAPQRRSLIEAIAKADVVTESLHAPDDVYKHRFTLSGIGGRATRQLQANQNFELPPPTFDVSGRSETGAAPPENGADAGASFAVSFAAALRRSPIDTVIETSPIPILHAVVPPPRIPKPAIDITQSDGALVDHSVHLLDNEDHITIELKPDSDFDTRFQLRIVPQTRGPSVAAHWWRDGRNVDDPEIVVSIPARESKTLRLNINARSNSKMISRVPLDIEIDPVDPPDSFVETLKSVKQLKLLLPQPDRIVVLAQTPNLTNRSKFIGDEKAPSGVWLRTFASRPTEFSLSAYNDSGKSCRAKVWLLRLRKPFPRNEVGEYFPSLVSERVNYMRDQLLTADGRVSKEELAGDRLLKGPKIITFGPDRVPTNISWKPNPPAEGEAAPPPAASADSAEPVDVSHGMALVVQLIDDSDAPVGTDDQIVWLIPDPLPPEDYVDLQYADPARKGEISVRPLLREKIDQDSRPDKVPDIDDNPVDVQWKEDRFWDGFRFSTTTEPGVLTAETGRPLKVQLAADGRYSIMRLGVDDWPRALRQRIDNFEPSKGRSDILWRSVQFAKVTINYDEDRPAGDDDQELEPSLSIFNPSPYEPIYFRGGGKSLQVGLQADISPTYTDAVLKIFEGNEVLQSHRSDRKFRTVLNGIKDIGDESRLQLMTTVEDLAFETDVAAKKNAQVEFRALVDVGPQAKPSKESEAELKIYLDSTRPQVNLRVEPPTGPYHVGSPVTWIAEYSDRGDVASGVRLIQMGADDGVGKPTGKRRSVRHSTSERQTITPKEPGELSMAVQVWDAVGLASEPVDRNIRVGAKPKPARSSGPPNSGGGDPVAAPKRGNIVGKIDTRSTMRGTLKLSPVPKDIQPANGQIKIGGASPQFAFRNVPEGEYTLIFLENGTINGRLQPQKVWSGLKIDNAGGEPFINLQLGDAE